MCVSSDDLSRLPAICILCLSDLTLTIDAIALTQNAGKHGLEGKNHAGEKACTGASGVEEVCSDSKEEPLSFAFLTANPEKLERLDATELPLASEENNSGKTKGSGAVAVLADDAGQEGSMQRKRSKPTPELRLLPMYQSDSLAILAVYCIAYVGIRQHTSADVSIRQHMSAYVSIRQHTSAYLRLVRACHPSQMLS